MKNKSLVTRIGICSAFLVSSMLLTNCVSKITEEQLMQLKDLRKQEVTLNQEIANKSTEITKVERELAARKAEADNCNKEKNYIKQKLAQWPNIWPDYTPNAPAGETK